MFLRSYLQNLLRAGDENINIAGYFAWSFFDNFEWREGYTKRFGIVLVDYATQKRTPKLSAKFYQELIKSKQLL
jgi:beta-glucosidase